MIRRHVLSLLSGAVVSAHLAAARSAVGMLMPVTSGRGGEYPDGTDQLMRQNLSHLLQDCVKCCRTAADRCRTQSTVNDPMGSAGGAGLTADRRTALRLLDEGAALCRIAGKSAGPVRQLQSPAFWQATSDACERVASAEPLIVPLRAEERQLMQTAAAACRELVSRHGNVSA